jgi:putative oxidoreductase
LVLPPREWVRTAGDDFDPAGGWGRLLRLRPDQVPLRQPGCRRFAKLGIPAPELLADFVGVVEIAAGLLLALGLATRLAAIPLVFDMLVAIGTSKLPVLFGPGPEPAAAAPKVGPWAFIYQARLDYTMLVCCLFLLVVGAGAWSLDAWLARSRRGSKGEDGYYRNGELLEAIPAGPRRRPVTLGTTSDVMRSHAGLK